ncbi:AAA family ATPase [Vallitalea guaymasensis]|uniref:AAA family ATPase n=1 Tax=Vallitalea guaymasensis TaxID=1185412 RepID=A0A8J8MC62_9FIRM|nr:AAA family ATPase [Vallitalea guaymasensis]QUH30314.1 AAA family ATPase [Vallitalea guaymasensis]
MKMLNGKSFIENKMLKTIIARRDELKCIKEEFDSVLEGGSGVVLVKGLPGIGKTFLVESLVRDLVSNNVTYVYGKFRKNNKKSFIAITEIIERMVKHILTLPPEQLKNIQRNLKETLGSDIEIITSISPYSSKLLGNYKSINIDNYNKLKYRIKKAVHRFISIVSESLFPLIIFIDDLHWADSSSLEIIEYLCKKNESLNTLLIVAYRNNKTENTSRRDNKKKIIQLEDTYMTMELQELTDGDISEYLQLIMGEETENINYLARFIYGLTLGNPFYMNEIINVFIQEAILIFSEQTNQWVVELDGLNRLSLPVDIEMVIIHKINKLDKAKKELLDIIACLDGKVDYHILRKIVDIDDTLLSNQLETLCQDAFLLKKIENEQITEIVTYDFVHDIILELVYKSIEPVNRKNIHYRIAETLLNNTEDIFVEKNRLFIVSQLLRSDKSILSYENTERWIYELYHAGIEAKRTTSVKQAIKIFLLSLQLISDYDFNEKDDMEMKINLELGECEFICEKYEEAKERFDSLITKYNKKENLIAIKRRYLKLHSHDGDCEKVIEIGLELLKLLDLDFNIKHLKMDLLKGKKLFSNKAIEQIKDKPIITDKRLLYILETLTTMIPAANCIDGNIFHLIIIKIGILSVKYGNSSYSPIGYGAYSYILYNVWNDYEKGKKLENITLELLESNDNLLTKSIVYSFIGAFVHHWSNPLEQGIEYLEKSTQEGARIGELIYSGYAIISIIYTKYVCGISLREITHYINSLEKDLHMKGYDVVKFIDYVFSPHVDYLEKGKVTKKYGQIKEEAALLNNTKGLAYNAFMIQRLFMECKIQEAYELVKKITPTIRSLKGHIIYVDLIFYSTLIRLAEHDKLFEHEKKENKRLIKECLRELNYWVNIYKENHYARYLLAKVEYTKLFDNNHFIDKLYNKAINYAEKQDNLQIGAVANYLTAKYHHESNRKLAEFYAREAVILYEEWGAKYIADLIEKEFNLEDDIHENSKAKLHNTIVEEKAETNENISEIIYNLINKIEPLEENEGIKYILGFLIDNHYADYGAVLFEKKDEMYLQYEKLNNRKVNIHREPVNMKYVNHMSHKIIRYVARTGEEIILNKKPEKGLYVRDLYIMNKDEVSILCIPINYLGVLIGIVYLEKARTQCFNGNIIKIIKSVIPTLISKRTTIKHVNLYNLLNPQNIISELTNREIEVLKLVAEGMSNASISKELYITLGTVKNHLSNIYSKLEVDSRIKAVIRAKDLNIINI